MRELCEIAFDHVGLDWEDHVDDRPAVLPARPRSTCSSAMPPRPGPKLGWKPEVSFEELVRMMVDADLAALPRSLESTSPTRRLLAGGE